jgi:predicted PhzF superfamily epimerase YddE/YHI9
MPPWLPVEVSEQLTAALGTRPEEVFLARDLLAIRDCESQVKNLQPDFTRMAALDAFAVIVSAPGESMDFVSRFFAPGAGDRVFMSGSAVEYLCGEIDVAI